MVKIYAVDVSNLPDPKEYPELLNGLSENRKEKTLRYRQLKDRKQSLGAGMLLQKCLSEHGICAEDIRYGENGKPEVSKICFNLSHSNDIVVCVVSEKEVGCDVEKISELRERIAERFFTEYEIGYLNGFEGDEKRDEFYRLWTMKESYMKMTGEGMSLSLDRFEFIFNENIKVYRDGELCSCFVKEYEIPGYKLTVCAQENRFEEILNWIEIS